MMTPTFEGNERDLKKRLFHRMRKLHGSLFTKSSPQESTVLDPTVVPAVALALDRDPEDVHCLSVPLTAPDLATRSGIGSLVTLGHRLSGNFLTLVYTAHENELRKAWKETSHRLSGKHSLHDATVIRERLETPLRSFILEEICTPLWERVEARLQQPCWQEVEDTHNRSLHSIARENVIGIPLLYAVAAVAGASALLDRLEPVLDHFARFIPFVRIRLDGEENEHHLWLGLDLLA